MSNTFMSARRFAVTGVLALVTAGTGFALASLPAQAAATNRYVAITGDDVDNDCTVQTSPCAHIQYAVGQADVGDTINIGPGEFTESVRIRKSLTLIGAGATGASKTVISGNHDGGVSVTVDGLDVSQTTAVTIKDIAVDDNADTDGIDVVGDASLDLVDSSASNNTGDGLAIDVSNATATVAQSTLSHNGGHGVEGSVPRELAAAIKPALVVASDITISHSDLSLNAELGLGLSSGATAAVDHSTVNQNGVGGIDVYGGSTLTLDTSTLDKNTGGGVFVETPADTATVTASTISNTVPASGDTEFGGAGLRNNFGTLDVAQSTIVGNTGQGVLNLGGVTTVANSTINGTKASVDKTPSGGLVNTQPEIPTLPARSAGSAKADVAVDTPASLTVTGSIVADQAATVPDCSGDIVDGGFNLSSDAANSCKFSAANHDLVSTNPLLGALADNGGPTLTELLLKGSPAIDAITGGNANCVSGATDQRGIARPQPVGNACDIGAVELAAEAIVIHPDSLPNGTVGQPYDAAVTATGGAYPTYVFSLVPGDSLPPGLGIDSNGHITGTPTTPGSFTFTVSVNDPVLKQYTIVITAPVPSSSTPAPTTTPSTPGTSTTPPGSSPVATSSTPAPSSSSSSSPVLSITGSPTAQLLSVAAAALLAGLALLFGTGRLGRRPRRH